MLPSNGSSKRKPASSLNLTPAQKKQIAAYLASQGIGSSGKATKPASGKVTKPASSGVNANKVGMGRNSPLTKTSLATNPLRALDFKEWGKAAEGAFGISDKNSAWTNAALAAMAFVPIPGLRNIGAVGRAVAKPAAAASKVAKVAAPAAKAAKPAAQAPKSAVQAARNKAIARETELADIRRLMQPDPRPARPIAKKSGGLSGKLQGGKPGKVMSSGPKPVRANYKSDATYGRALKRWEAKVESNRVAARAGGDSLPIAPKAKPPVSSPLAKDAAKPATKKPAVRKPKASKPKTEKPTPAPKPKPKAIGSRSAKPGTDIVLRRGSAVATRAERAGAPKGTAGRELTPDLGVPTTAYARPRPGAAGRPSAPKAIGPGKTPKPATTKKPLMLEGPKKPAVKPKKSRKGLIGLGVAAAGLTAAGAALDKAGKKSEGSPSSSGLKAPKVGLLDKYGRKITREEFNRRESYRNKTKNMTAKEKAAARKKEMARRKNFRATTGTKRFGSSAVAKTRKVGATRLDDRARESLKN